MRCVIGFTINEDIY